MKVTARAYAKLNLDLRVLGARSDGFHELRTVFQTIALHDRLTLTARPGPFVLRCAAPGVPGDDRNLVWRAAALLWRALGRPGEPHDVLAELRKNIPVAAGLGGGSADAAAALVAFSRLWGYRFTAPQLHDLAARLGADVPFCLYGGLALGLGRGDEIHLLDDLPRVWIVLASPAAGVRTRDAYAWYRDEHATPGHAAPAGPRLPKSWLPSAVQLVNDLEPAVARRVPQIAQLRTELRERGAIGVAMSGSGTTVFGLFRRRPSAAAAWAGLRRSGWRAMLTSTMGRTEYARASSPRLSSR